MCDINFARLPGGTINFQTNDLCEDNKASSLIIFHAKQGDTFSFYDDPEMRPDHAETHITVSYFSNYMYQLHSIQQMLRDINEPLVIPSVGLMDDYFTHGRKKREASEYPLPEINWNPVSGKVEFGIPLVPLVQMAWNNKQLRDMVSAAKDNTGLTCGGMGVPCAR